MVGPSRNGVNKSLRMYRSRRQPWRHQDAYLWTLAPYRGKEENEDE